MSGGESAEDRRGGGPLRRASHPALSPSSVAAARRHLLPEGEKGGPARGERDHAASAGTLAASAAARSCAFFFGLAFSGLL